MTLFRTAFLLTALALVATPLSAQQNGTYTTGMGYTIEVSFNGISYTMEVGDGDTLIANKPGAPRENGTELRLVGSADAADPVDEDEAERMLGVAQQYLARVQSARALRQIAVSSSNPCNDAIPDAIWNEAN
ncbi:MAG: hypothetical protein ACKODA_06685 [Nevskiaceae bacterium]